jgi:tetratricopeptide (TPR) repeat protein
LSDWHVTCRLAKPFDGWEQHLSAGVAKPDGQTLVRTASAAGAIDAVVRLKDAGSQATELTVTFAPAWEQATELGLLMHLDKQVGYEFLLTVGRASAALGSIIDEPSAVEPPSAAAPGSNPAPVATPALGPVSDRAPVPTEGLPSAKPGTLAIQRRTVTFAQARQQGGTLLAVIRRHGVRLQRREIVLSDLPQGPLPLRFRRDRDQLIAQVGALPELKSFDPFPLPAATGVLALRWPTAVPLVQLQLASKTLPPQPSPLDEADLLYDAGQFAQALDRYADEARRAGSATQDEARHKQALCLAALNRADEAVAIWDQLRAQPGDRWPLMAACQLWRHYVLKNRDADADALFTLLQTQAKGEDLVLLVSSDFRDELVDRYLKEFQQPARMLRYDPGGLQRVERAVRVLDLLVPAAERDLFRQQMLARAYEFEGQLERALPLYKLFVNLDTRGYERRHYYRVLRLLNRAPQAVTELDEELKRVSPSDDPAVHQLLLLERIRSRWVAKADRSLVDSDRSEALRLAEASSGMKLGDRAYMLGDLLLLRGFLLLERGDEVGARAAWQTGFAAVGRRCWNGVGTTTTT